MRRSRPGGNPSSRKFSSPGVQSWRGSISWSMRIRTVVDSVVWSVRRVRVLYSSHAGPFVMNGASFDHLRKMRKAEKPYSDLQIVKAKSETDEDGNYQLSAGTEVVTLASIRQKEASAAWQALYAQDCVETYVTLNADIFTPACKYSSSSAPRFVLCFFSIHLPCVLAVDAGPTGCPVFASFASHSF